MMKQPEFKIYTVKGLLQMSKDVGLTGLGKAKRDVLSKALASADLSKLDLDSYPKLKVDGPKVSKTEGKTFVKSSARRRSVNPGAFGRR